MTREKPPKPPPPRKPARLSEKAIAGAVIDAAGASAEEVGRKLGVHAQTVGEWRRSPEYRALVNGHRAKTEAAIRDDLLDVRRTVLDGLRTTAKAAAALVLDAPDDLEVVTKAGKLLIDLWRPIAAQTGISETTKHEVSQSPPEDARRILHEELAALPPETLRRIRDGRPESS